MSARPLPPNRRVKSAPKRTVQAPDERAESELPPELDDLPPSVDDQFRPVRASSGGSGGTRWLDALRATAGVLFTVGGALACVWGLVRYTRTSPRFAIRYVEVTGTLHRTSDDVSRLGGVALGQNVFGTDLESARVRILGDPWIEKVTLGRRLPGTVKIEVVEREASALVSIGSDLYLVTRDGEPFKKMEPGDPYDLPIVTGILPGEVSTDRQGVVLTIHRALDLAAEYERVGPSRRLPLQEIHVQDDGGLVLVVGKDAISLRMGKGPYRQPIEQAARVLSEVAARRAQAAVVFLDNDAHPERVVVRMR